MEQAAYFIFPGADFKQRVQKCCLMWCDCVLERFKLKNLFTKFNQPELWLLTANVNLKRRLSGPSVMRDQCNYSQCVFLLTFIMASTMQSGNEAKHVMCSVFNDISHLQCFVTAHKLNFEPTSQTLKPLTRPAVSPRGRPREQRKSSPN